MIRCISLRQSLNCGKVSLDIQLVLLLLLLILIIFRHHSDYILKQSTISQQSNGTTAETATAEDTDQDMIPTDEPSTSSCTTTPKIPTPSAVKKVVNPFKTRDAGRKSSRNDITERQMAMMNAMEQQSKQFSEQLTAINNSQQEMMGQFGQLLQMVMQPYHVQTFGGMQHQLNSSPLSPLSLRHSHGPVPPTPSQSPL